MMSKQSWVETSKGGVDPRKKGMSHWNKNMHPYVKKTDKNCINPVRLLLKWWAT